MRVVTMSRKPIDGTVAANALKWGCGGMNINSTRIGTDGGTRREGRATKPTAAGWSNMGGHSIAELGAGRWPANMVLCPEASDALDNQSGITTNTSHYSYQRTGGFIGNIPSRPEMDRWVSETGGASRYFKQISQGGDMTAVPQDLIDYLVTMISPPEPHPKAVFWDSLPDDMDLVMMGGNTLTGLIIRPKSKSEPTEAQSKELLRILRPGAHLLIIAPDDQPTGHTAVCMVEDAGFEVRDAICWANEAGDGDRLHYVAKASRSEREAGCQDLPTKTGAEATNRGEDTAALNSPRTGAGRLSNEVHNFHPCLHPEAVVMTDQGYRPIQDIRLGDRVFAADGSFHSVDAVTRHPYTSDCLYKISVKGTNLTTLASDNHPFLIWRPRRKGNYIQGGDVLWASADQVVKGDYTMTPIVGQPTSPVADVDNLGFWFVFGLWLAEGVSQKAGHGDKCYPSFSLHAKETYLVDRIKALTTKNVSVYEHGDNGIQVMVFDHDMGSAFKRLGGSGASTKVIDPSVWLLNTQCRKALVDGYMAGDGGKVRTYIQAKSVSMALASQITYLAESIGYKVCLYWFAAQPGKIGNRVFKKTLPTYQMQFYSDDMNQTTRKPVRPTRIDHDGVPYSLRYVQGVDKVPYQGDVVNLSVEGSHTFQTAVGMSHNTVKPILLMEHLLGDVPKDQGPVVDPFLGSGTTGIACVKTGHDFIGIEREDDFIAISDARIRHWKDKTYKGDKWDDIQIVSDYTPSANKPKPRKAKAVSNIEDLFG